VAPGEGCFCSTTFNERHHDGQRQYRTFRAHRKGVEDDVVGQARRL